MARAGDEYFRYLKARRRLLSKCKIVGDCWVWQGLRRTDYGVITVAGKLRNAHRAAYALFVGPVPLGASVMHSCKNPLCCAPDHLYLGIQEQPLTAGPVAEAMA